MPLGSFGTSATVGAAPAVIFAALKNYNTLIIIGSVALNSPSPLRECSQEENYRSAESTEASTHCHLPSGLFVAFIHSQFFLKLK